MSRVALLLSSVALVSTLAGSTADAHACSPPPPPPPAGTYAINLDLVGASAPKNGGLVLTVSRTPEIAEDDLIGQTKISVRSGADEVPGTVRRYTTANAMVSKWVWVPTGNAGQLPPGAVHVSITSAAQPSALREAVEVDVTIEDRILAPPKGAPNVELRRALVFDETSPKITCRWEGSSAACEFGPQERQVPSRVLGLANLLYLVPDIAQKDASFLERDVELFGKDADGAKGPSEVAPIYGGGGSWNFDRTYAEYCAKLTTRVLADGNTSAEEVCVPHGALDLSVSEQDAKREVDAQLSRCETIVYPEGAAATAEPTGEPPLLAAASAGCAVNEAHRRTPAAGASVLVLLGSVVALLRRRRKDA